MIQFSDSVKGISCVGAAFLFLFSLGTVYTFGNMSPYIASYLKYRANNSWVTNGEMVWIYAMAIFAHASTMVLGGLLEKKLGSRITCWIGGWLMSFGTMMTYFSIKSNFFLVILTYGTLFGVGTGLSYSVALARAIKWFPRRKGLVSGTVVAGYGLGSLVFNLVQTAYINPNNISPNATDPKDRYFTNDTVLDNVPHCFLVIGAVYALLQLIGVILLANPAYKIVSEEESQIIDKTEAVNDDSCPAVREYTALEAIKEYKLWLLSVTFFLNGIVIVTGTSLYKSFGQTFINNDRFLSIVGSVSALFNFGGRLVWGMLFDGFYYKKVMSLLVLLSTIMIGTFYFCSTLKSEAMFFIYVCLLFFIVGGSFSIFPAVTAKCFGSEHMATTYGFVFFGVGASGIIGAMISTFLQDYINYWGQFVIATIFSFISLVLTQFFPNSYHSSRIPKCC